MTRPALDTLQDLVDNTFDYRGPDRNDMSGEHWDYNPEAVAALASVRRLIEAAQAVDAEHEAGLPASVGAAERLHAALAACVGDGAE